MKIYRFGEKRVYAVDKRLGNEWAIYKVLNLYNNEKEAYSDLYKLLNKQKTEEELLEEFKKKDNASH